MSLLTYDDAKKYARRHQEQASAIALMPPWHIDKTVGIQEFKNDRSLTDDQIDDDRRAGSITGMPMGDPKDLPPPVTFPDPNGWQFAKQFGEPDLVLKSPPYTLAARTQDKWFRPVTDTGPHRAALGARDRDPPGQRSTAARSSTTCSRCSSSTRKAASRTSRSSAHDMQMTAGLFMEWAVGKTGELYNTDAGKLMLPGSKIRWEIHMFAIGQEIKDSQVELAIYFYPKGTVPPHRTVLRMFDVSRGSKSSTFRRTRRR